MAQREFDCKEKDCDKKVVYEKREIIALTTVMPKQPEPRKKRRVYLTCEDGHTHPYIVEES